MAPPVSTFSRNPGVSSRIWLSEVSFKLIYTIVDKVVSENLALKVRKQNSAFCCDIPPAVTFKDYVERLKKTFECTDSCCLVALLYMSKIVVKNSLMLTSTNCHRMYLGCLLVACKFYDDIFYTNAYYAYAAGVSLSHLNMLERATLEYLGYNLIIEPAIYRFVLEHLPRQVLLPKDYTPMEEKLSPLLAEYDMEIAKEAFQDQRTCFSR